MDRAGIRRRGSRWWWLTELVMCEQVGVSRAKGNDGGGTKREREKGADGASLIFPSLFSGSCQVY